MPFLTAVHLHSGLSHGDDAYRSCVKILNFLDPDETVRFIDLEATVLWSMWGQANSWPKCFRLLNKEQLAIFKIAISGASNVFHALSESFLLESWNRVEIGDRIFLRIYGDALTLQPCGSPPVLPIPLHLKTTVPNHFSKITLVKKSKFIIPLVLRHFAIVDPLHLKIMCNKFD